MHFKPGVQVKVDPNTGNFTGIPSNWKGILPGQVSDSSKIDQTLIPELPKDIEKELSNVRPVLTKQQSEVPSHLRHLPEIWRNNGDRPLEQKLNKEDPANLFDIQNPIGNSKHLYKAQGKDNRQYCIDTVSVEPDSNLDAIENNVVLQSNLSDAHIVSYLDTYARSPGLWVVREFISGGSIQDMIQAHLRLKEPRIAEILHDVLLALKYLHERRIIHGDVKSKNVLFDERIRKWKLTGFKFSIQLRKGEKCKSDQGTPHVFICL